MATKTQKVDINTLNAWLYEATFAAQDARAQMWIDCGFRDGDQWFQDRLDIAENSSVKALTINRTFPVLNMIEGLYITNKLTASAKGRTSKDTETALAISEGLQFITDQCDGEFLIRNAFSDQTIPGIGWLFCGYNPDPRKEKIRVAYRDWKEMWWDPFASPWLNPEQCRYAIYQRWMDLDDLKALFPGKDYEIGQVWDNVSGSSRAYGSLIYDEAQQVEDLRRTLTGSGAADTVRSRVRPAEIWYTIYQEGLYARFSDGRVYEVMPDADPMEQFQIVKASIELVKAPVKKMRVATVLGDLILQDIPTPFPHDDFPFIPFVGYLDRYNRPFGVVRQLRDMNIEVNERRSMALALLQKKQVIAETTVVDKPEKLQTLYEEGQKADGMLVVQPGSTGKIQIIEHGQMAQAQVGLMEQSEREIQQISGANEERMGYVNNSMSSAAIDKRQQQSTVINSSIFDNFRRSLKTMSNQLVCLMQGNWTQEKVLRITDRLTGAERFVELNKRIKTENGYEVRNDITQGKYDIVVSEAPITDTVREKNMEMIIEWVKKSPPEMIPHLMNLAFELSSIPGKDVLLAKIKPILGIDPTTEDMTEEQLKQAAIQKMQQQAAEAQKQSQFADEQVKLTLENQALLNKKLEAEIANLINKPNVDNIKAQATADKVELASIKTGADIQHKKDVHQLNRDKTEFDAIRDMAALKNQREQQEGVNNHEQAQP